MDNPTTEVVEKVLRRHSHQIRRVRLGPAFIFTGGGGDNPLILKRYGSDWLEFFSPALGRECAATMGESSYYIHS